MLFLFVWQFHDSKQFVSLLVYYDFECKIILDTEDLNQSSI